MFSYKTILAGFVLFLSTQASAASFQEAPEGFQKVYGPEKLWAGFPKNRVHKIQFDTSKPEEQFFIRIVNGNGEAALQEDCKNKRGLERARCEIENVWKRFANELLNVDKVTLEVNDKKILKNENFKKIQTYLDVPVQFKEKNKIEFSLKGSIVSYIQVLIFQSGQENQIPVASFTFALKGNDEPLAVVFDASASQDPDGNIASQIWQFGDGQTAEGVQVEHVYPQFGEFSVTLTVTDDRGGSAQSTQVVSVFDEVAPVLTIAQPLEGAVIETESVAVAGTSNEALALAEVSGQALILSEDKKSFSGSLILPEGSHSLNFAVEDLAGNRTEQAVSIQVNINLPPVAGFGFVFPDSANPGLISVGHQASDSDGQVVEIVYDWGDGSTTSSLEEFVTHTYAQEGTYQITQTVRDNENKVATFTRTAIVSFSNPFPRAVLSADQYSGPVGLTINVDSKGSFDPNGAITAYQWRIHRLDGSIDIFSDQPTASYTFNEAGIFRLRLRVRDNLGAASFSDAYIVVGGVIAPQPVISATPGFGRAPLTVSLNGFESLNAGDSPLTSLFWDLGDGAKKTGGIIGHIFQNPGDYEVRLTITDEDGRSATSSAIVNVFEVEPQLTIDLKVTQNGAGSPTVQFFAQTKPISSSIPWPPQSLSYQWSFGDGATGTGAAIQHSYQSEGPFDVRVEVTDDQGRKGFARRRINHVTSPQTGTELKFLIYGKSGPAPRHIRTDARYLQEVLLKFKNFRWDFSEGEILTGPVAGHTYENQGNYQVKLLAQTVDGFDVMSEPQEVVVSGLKPIVKAVIEAEANFGVKYYNEETIFLSKFSDLVHLSAGGSSSRNAEKLSYVWTTPNGQYVGEEILYFAQALGPQNVQLTVRDENGNEDSASLTVHLLEEACFLEDGDDLCLSIQGSTNRHVFDFNSNLWTVDTGLTVGLKSEAEQNALFEVNSRQSWVQLTDEEGTFYDIRSAAAISGSNVSISKVGLEALNIPLDSAYSLRVSVIDENDVLHAGSIDNVVFGIGTAEISSAQSTVVNLRNDSAGYFSQRSVVSGQPLSLSGLPAGVYSLTSIDQNVTGSFEIHPALSHAVVDLSPSVAPVAMQSLLREPDTVKIGEDTSMVSSEEDFQDWQEMQKNVSMSSAQVNNITDNPPPTEEDGSFLYNCLGQRAPFPTIPGLRKQVFEEVWKGEEIYAWERGIAHPTSVSDSFFRYKNRFAPVNWRRIIRDGDKEKLQVRCRLGSTNTLPLAKWKRASKDICCSMGTNPQQKANCLAIADQTYALALTEAKESEKNFELRFTVRDVKDPSKSYTKVVTESYLAAVNRRYGSIDRLFSKGIDEPVVSLIFRHVPYIDIDLPLSDRGIERPEMKIELGGPAAESSNQNIHCGLAHQPEPKPIVKGFKAVSPNPQDNTQRLLASTGLLPLDTQAAYAAYVPQVGGVGKFTLRMKVALSPADVFEPDGFEIKIKRGDVEHPIDIKLSEVTALGFNSALDANIYGMDVNLEDADETFVWSPGTQIEDGIIEIRALWNRPDGSQAKSRSQDMPFKRPASFNVQQTDAARPGDKICMNDFYSQPVAWGKGTFIETLYELKIQLVDWAFRCNDLSHPFGGNLRPHSGQSHKMGSGLDLRYFKTALTPVDNYDRWASAGPCRVSGKSSDVRDLVSYAEDLHAKYFSSSGEPRAEEHLRLFMACSGPSPQDSCSLLNQSEGTYQFKDIHMYCYNTGLDLENCLSPPFLEAERLSGYIEANRERIEHMAKHNSMKEIFIGIGDSTAEGGATCLPTGWHQAIFSSGRLPTEETSVQIPLSSNNKFVEMGAWSGKPSIVVFEPGHDDHLHIGEKQ